MLPSAAPALLLRAPFAITANLPRCLLNSVTILDVSPWRIDLITIEFSLRGPLSPIVSHLNYFIFCLFS